MLDIELNKAFNESICCYTKKDIRKVLDGKDLCGECNFPLAARFIGNIMLTGSDYYHITCHCDESVYWAVIVEDFTE